MHLATGTVRNYVSMILQKLEVGDRTQAAVVAFQRGLIRQFGFPAEAGISSDRT